jgi:hypothetical protein
MTVRRRSSTAILPLVLLGLMVVALSCAPAEAGPRAWIDWPPNGFETSVGTTLTLIAHAYAEEGVAEVQLAVDRQPYRVVSPDRAGEEFVQVSVEWFADEPGIYLLSVTSLDVNGQASSPASVTVHVTGEGPQFVLTAEPETTAPPTTPSPEEEPAATLAPTETLPPPTATSPRPTGTPLPPTATPEPPRITSFEVNRSQITAGECVRFSWRIDGYPTAIYFDGEGVTSPDSADRCPTATRAFELRAEGPSGADVRSITVVVVEPSPTPDTVGPSAPSLVSPTGNQGVGCADVTLDWRAASDPSGIGTYYVKVEKETSPGTWQSAGGWTTTATQYTIPVAWLECGQTYRWAVAAEDALGNMGPWSGWAEFTVEIT